MKPKWQVEPPPLHHREPLRMPEVGPQPLRPVSGRNKTRLRILAELHPPPDPTRKPYRTLLLLLPLRSGVPGPRPLPDPALGGPVAGRPPPLVPADLEVVVDSRGDGGVEGLELGGAGLGEVLDV